MKYQLKLNSESSNRIIWVFVFLIYCKLLEQKYETLKEIDIYAFEFGITFGNMIKIHNNSG